MVLDMNELAQIHPNAIIGQVRPSPDHTFVCFTLDTHGPDSMLVHFRHIASGAVVKLKLPEVTGVTGFEWGSMLDGHSRPYVIYVCGCEGKLRANVVFKFGFAVSDMIEPSRLKLLGPGLQKRMGRIGARLFPQRIGKVVDRMSSIFKHRTSRLRKRTRGTCTVRAQQENFL
jgi:hypothetical protein